MFHFVKRFLKAYNDAEILKELELLKNDFARLQNHVLLSENEIYDTILAKLERINKSNEQRLKREKEKSRNEEENQETEKGGRQTIGGIPLYGGRSQWR